MSCGLSKAMMAAAEQVDALNEAIDASITDSYKHLRAHETGRNLVIRHLL